MGIVRDISMGFFFSFFFWAVRKEKRSEEGKIRLCRGGRKWGESGKQEKGVWRERWIFRFWKEESSGGERIRRGKIMSKGG